MRHRKTIEFCLTQLLIVLLLNPWLSDANIFEESLAENENEQYTQKLQWNQTYGGANHDSASAFVQTADGGFALAGFTASFGAGGHDFWLVKTTADGTALWNQTYGGTGGETAYALIQTSDGGFALAGSTKSFGTGVSNMYLVKTNAYGDMEWNQTYGGTEAVEAFSFIQTTDIGFALAGVIYGLELGLIDFLLVKTNASGDMEWNQTYGGTEAEELFSVIQTTDGGFALVGYTSSYGTGTSDFWLIKTKADGTIQWNQTYGGRKREWGRSLNQTADNGFALAGYTESYGVGKLDFWLVKTSVDGTAQWNQTYGGIGSESANALIQTIDDGFTLAGYTESYGTGISDMWLVKTTPSGNTEWNWTYGGTAEDGTNALVQTAENSFVLAGSTKSYGAGESDMILVKIITTKITTTMTTTDTTDNGTSGMEIFPLLIAIVILTLWNKWKKLTFLRQK